MSNTREKLIDLLDAITEYYRFDAWENADKIADYLIANGVRLETETSDKVGTTDS